MTIKPLEQLTLKEGKYYRKDGTEVYPELIGKRIFETIYQEVSGEEFKRKGFSEEPEYETIISAMEDQGLEGEVNAYTKKVIINDTVYEKDEEENIVSVTAEKHIHAGLFKF